MMKKTKLQENKLFRTPRGMHDVLPEEAPWWDRVNRVAKELADFYNFGCIRTPILEFAKLYEKGTGDATDVVKKEMYTLRTKGGDVLALRPEFTPGVMRAYVEHGLSRLSQPQKLYSAGPVFRHEAPQAGRFRQFHQVNFEIIGGQSDPIYDAQAILIAQRLLEELRLKGVVLRLNSLGCKICRPNYKRQLQSYYKGLEKKLCLDCVQRLKTNPLRLLDCKDERCQEFKAKAPNILDKLCANCSSHFRAVLEYLDEVSISYNLDNQLVRGLDYYSRTVFEASLEGAGAELGALAAGGRYDYLMEMLGGKPVPAMGFAAGIERLVAGMKIREVKLPARSGKKVFFVHVGDLAKKKSLRIIEDLRRAGISVSEALGRESLKAQLKTADKEGFELALIFGQREVFEENIIIRDLRKSSQETVVLSKLGDEIKKRLKND
jgi:histidyl-tRNA synthetase